MNLASHPQSLYLFGFRLKNTLSISVTSHSVSEVLIFQMLMLTKLSYPLRYSVYRIDLSLAAQITNEMSTSAHDLPVLMDVKVLNSNQIFLQDFDR